MRTLYHRLIIFLKPSLTCTYWDAQSRKEKRSSVLLFSCSVRFADHEVANMAALLGGLVAQEAIKIITRQYTPINNTCIFNGIASTSNVYELWCCYSEENNKKSVESLFYFLHCFHWLYPDWILTAFKTIDTTMSGACMQFSLKFHVLWIAGTSQ